MQWNLQDMGILSMSGDPAAGDPSKSGEAEQKEPGETEEGETEATFNPNAERYSNLIKVCWNEKGLS